jgi:hypothetical protein
LAVKVVSNVNSQRRTKGTVRTLRSHHTLNELFNRYSVLGRNNPKPMPKRRLEPHRSRMAMDNHLAWLNVRRCSLMRSSHGRALAILAIKCHNTRWPRQTTECPTAACPLFWSCCETCAGAQSEKLTGLRDQPAHSAAPSRESSWRYKAAAPTPMDTSEVLRGNNAFNERFRCQSALGRDLSKPAPIRWL